MVKRHEPGNVDVIFWGATGQAKVLRECISQFNCRLIALFDNNPEVASPFPDVPIFYGEAGYRKWLSARGIDESECHCLVAIGGKLGKERLQIQSFLENTGMKTMTVCHPSAFVAENVVLGNGAQVLAGACVCVNCHVGDACIVNTGACVDHDSLLQDGAHIAPGVTITGEVNIGRYAMIGAGAVILPRISIGEGALVGAGAVVTRNVPDYTVVYGNPARIIRTKRY